MPSSRFQAASAGHWLCCLLLALLGLLQPVRADTAKPVIEIYVSPGCPHCAEAQDFLRQLAIEQPGLQLKIFDIQHNPEALPRLQLLSRQAGIAQAGVPSLWVGQQLIVGFDSPATSGARIRAALAGSSLPTAADNQATCRISDETLCRPEDESSIEIPLLGQKISIAAVGLPLFTIVIGLLDGFNPCSMWVLLLMISLLAALGDRRRMLAIAGTFVALQGMAYFAFMAAWLNLFLLIGLSRLSEIAIALFAIVAGCLNLKDFVAFGRGPTLSIPVAAKPGIYARLRAILQTERLWPALLGTALLALLVQMVELLCTSGFPALYTRLLTLHQLDAPSYYGYLLLYNLMYMLDDVLILGIGVLTLSQRRLQEKEGRRLKLLAGLVMLGLGLYLLLPGSR
ncbi:glutaredoxin family protein [Dechloromonas denitrificans]|uniref:glutaredoxin family protein n=1 Tax=Dechloromonas denitrificans TaxID=281362 RepID=UPI0009F8859B|nr:glutaredoxin domain-containing protein [Dechloromonas denitrificans]